MKVTRSKRAKLADPESKEKPDEEPKGVTTDATGKPVLVVLPGASGQIGANMRDLILTVLSERMTIKSASKFNWNKMRAGCAENVAQVLALCPSDAPFFILGNSFGNRVICEMLAEKKLPHCQGVIMCGYPLYGPTKQVDKSGVNPRVAQLLSVPAGVD